MFPASPSIQSLYIKELTFFVSLGAFIYRPQVQQCFSHNCVSPKRETRRGKIACSFIERFYLAATVVEVATPKLEKRKAAEQMDKGNDAKKSKKAMGELLILCPPL